MSDLQQRAEVRRFATFSEEELLPLDFSVIAQHPIMAPARWLASKTLSPLQAWASKAIGDAVDSLATQPEVLVWSLEPGDHLRVRGVAGLMALTHHALYLGEGRIMHFTGGVTDKANATIRVDTLHTLYKFTQSIGNKNCRIHVVPHPPDALPREVIVQRALSREGETGYNLFEKNCEHVVYWCITGKQYSDQVESFRSDPIGLGLSIFKEQAEAGAPLNLKDICRTLLPPSLWQSIREMQEQQDKVKQVLASVNMPSINMPSISQVNTPFKLPWTRDRSWLQEIQMKVASKFKNACEAAAPWHTLPDKIPFLRRSGD